MKYANYSIEELNYLHERAMICNDTYLQNELETEIEKRIIKN